MNLLQFYKQILGKVRLGYYDGELSRVVIGKDGRVSFEKEPEFEASIVIVSRAFYQEKLSSYPVDNRRELKKLLALNHSDKSCSLIHEVADGHSWVNEWLFDSGLPKALFYLPESLLFAQSIEQGAVLEVKRATSLFVSLTARGVASASASPLLCSPEMYIQAAGLSRDTKQTVSGAGDAAQDLISGLARLPLASWPAFVNQQRPALDSRRLKKMSLIAGAFISSYLALTCGYLLLTEQALQAKIESNRNEVNQALNVQNQYNHLQDFLSRHSEFGKRIMPIDSLWAVMLPLYEQANFTRINYQGERFILIGETDKATDILNHLIQQKLVTDARFDFPVRKNRKRERFTISFRLAAADGSITAATKTTAEASDGNL